MRKIFSKLLVPANPKEKTPQRGPVPAGGVWSEGPGDVALVVGLAVRGDGRLKVAAVGVRDTVAGVGAEKREGLGAWRHTPHLEREMRSKLQIRTRLQT